MKILVGLIYIAFLAGALVQAEAAKKNEHHHHGAADATVQSNNGKKWPTDGPLRENMDAIHKLLKKNINNIKKGTLDEKKSAELGQGVGAKIDKIFKECKLPAKADAQLHVILADMIKGKEVLVKKASQPEYQKAAKRILGSYKSYLKNFEAEMKPAAE